MKALVYNGAGKRAVEERPKPTIKNSKDAIIRLTKTTICGTDLNILRGHSPEVPNGCILGHEGVGIVEEVGSDVSNYKVGDKVIISCITACGTCNYCKKSLYSHCENGGWILGHLIDGTQAEYVRIPQADNSLHKIPKGLSDDAAVMISDILPTGHEIGVQAGNVKPGDTVAIVGVGPIGMSALLTAQFYSPAKIIAIDLDDNRLAAAKKFGATHTVNSKNLEEALKQINEITDGIGCDVVMEAVGFPATFGICQKIVAAGGHISNIGVHGEVVDFHLEDLWIKNITLSAGLVNTNTSPMLIKTCAAGKIEADQLVTHYFKFDEIMEAYDVFGKAAETKALKVIIDF